MNLRSSIYPFVLALCAYAWLGHSTGPGSAQDKDRTGSPVSPDFCQACHSGGDFGTDVQILLLQGEDTIQEYEPGTSYTLQVSISANGAEGYGFQAVALGQDSSSVGVFGTPPDGMQITQVDGRAYAEHNQRSSIPIFEIEWIAPGSGTGDVTFYAAGNAVNGNFETSGDLPDTSTFVITEGSVSGILAQLDMGIELQLTPNPVHSELKVTWSGDLQSGAIEIRDVTGLTYRSQTLKPSSGSEATFTLQDIPSGIYVVTAATDKGLLTRKFAKL